MVGIKSGDGRQSGFEFAAHGPEGAAENSAKRAVRQAKRSFDRRVIQFLEITQRHRGPVQFGQLREGGLDFGIKVRFSGSVFASADSKSCGNGSGRRRRAKSRARWRAMVKSTQEISQDRARANAISTL